MQLGLRSSGRTGKGLKGDLILGLRKKKESEVIPRVLACLAKWKVTSISEGVLEEAQVLGPRL